MTVSRSLPSSHRVPPRAPGKACPASVSKLPHRGEEQQRAPSVLPESKGILQDPWVKVSGAVFTLALSYHFLNQASRLVADTTSQIIGSLYTARNVTVVNPSALDRKHVLDGAILLVCSALLYVHLFTGNADRYVTPFCSSLPSFPVVPSTAVPADPLSLVGIRNSGDDCCIIGPMQLLIHVFPDMFDAAVAHLEALLAATPSGSIELRALHEQLVAFRSAYAARQVVSIQALRQAVHALQPILPATGHQDGPAYVQFFLNLIPAAGPYAMSMRTHRTFSDWEGDIRRLPIEKQQALSRILSGPLYQAKQISPTLPAEESKFPYPLWVLPIPGVEGSLDLLSLIDRLFYDSRGEHLYPPDNAANGCYSGEDNGTKGVERPTLSVTGRTQLVGAAPQHLILQPRRTITEPNAQGVWEEKKITVPLHAPMHFSFKPEWMETPVHPLPSYTCKGFLKHSGSARSGHYTAYVLSANGKWWHCNDSTVSQVSSQEAQKELNLSPLISYRLDKK